MSLIKVTDRTAPERHAVLDGIDVAPVVGQWMAADGGIVGNHLSPNVAGLARAITAGDWTRVHAIADFLSMDVEVLFA